MFQCDNCRERGQPRHASADADLFTLQIFRPLDARMGDQLVSDFVLIAHDHNHIAARHHGIHDMSRTNQTNRNFTGIQSALSDVI